MILSKYFRIENGGKLVFLPQSNSQSLPHETFQSGAFKCAARNAAFALICNEFSQENPMHIMVIDSAENITMFHLVAGLIAGSEKKRLNLVELNLVAVSHSVKWDDFSDGTISLQGLPSTHDAYSKAHYGGCNYGRNYNAIFLDACGLAPGLLNDICGMPLRDSTNQTNPTNPTEISVFETMAKTGGVFGITWQNTRQYCTRKNLRRTDLSETTRNVIFGYTDAAGIYHPGYGVYVKQKSKTQKSHHYQQKTSNDEIPHYEWMIGLMQHVAKMHGFQLELAYSAYESKGCMRTVIFRVFPLDVLHDSFVVYSQLSALESFYPCLSDEALKAHGNALYNQYLVPVFTEALEQFQYEQSQSDILRIQTLWAAIEKKIIPGKIIPGKIIPGKIPPLMSAILPLPMTFEQRELRALLTQVAEVVPFMSRENCEVGIKCLLPLFQDAVLASETVLPKGFDDMKGKALLSTIIERRHEKPKHIPKKHIPNEDYVLDTGNVSKIHRGGFECKAVKAFSAKKYITLQHLNDTGKLDKCRFCFVSSKRERE